MSGDPSQPPKRLRTAQILIALGCLVILLGSAMHLIAAFPIVSAELLKSNLTVDLRNALRSVFFMIGLTWILVAIVACAAAFSRKRVSKRIVVLCGLGLLLQTPIWIGFMGWFVGNEMFLAGSALMAVGGFLLPVPSRRYLGLSE